MPGPAANQSLGCWQNESKHWRPPSWVRKLEFWIAGGKHFGNGLGGDGGQHRLFLHSENAEWPNSSAHLPLKAQFFQEESGRKERERENGAAVIAVIYGTSVEITALG